MGVATDPDGTIASYSDVLIICAGRFIVGLIRLHWIPALYSGLTVAGLMDLLYWSRIMTVAQ